MTQKDCENFFKSSARSAGLRIYNEAKVTISKPSALEVIAYVKPNFRVSLKLESIQGGNLNADCNCTQSKKGELCKHIWAACVCVFEKSADFFEASTEILKKDPEIRMTKPQSDAQIASKEAFKLKQETYRKEQYQKQKARAKEFKKNKKKTFEEPPAFPRAVQIALDYFSQNGFSFENALNEIEISTARKKLARIFHPDIGGSHEEILELSNNTEILLKFVGKRS